MLKRKSKLTLAIIINIVLLMTLYINSVNAASTVKGDNFDYDEATLNKYIINEDTENNIYDIVLEIEGKNKAEVPPTDIVLVVDESGSMTGAKYQTAKNAVVAFSDKLLSESENVTIGYVGFADDVPSDKKLAPTNDKVAFSTFVNGLTDASGGGTHLQAGLKEAREMLEAKPADHRKTIIILSDGLATYSYKPTSIGAIVGDEIKAYGYKDPPHKVTGYDYATRVGSGGTYDLLDGAFKIGEVVISSTGEATIGELSAFKENPNNSVYSIGIDVLDTFVGDSSYQYVKEETTSRFGTIVLNSSWSESNRNGIYDPGEKIKVVTEFRNDDTTTMEVSAVSNVIQDSSTAPIPAKTRDYVENTGEIIQRMYVDGVVAQELTFDQVMERQAATWPVYIQVPVGSTYRVETEFTMKDFTLMGPGINSMNTMHLAQYKIKLNKKTGSSGFTAFAYDYNKDTGPILAFHSPYETGKQGEYILKNLSTDGTEGSTYFDADGVETLLEIFVERLYSKITDSIINGVVTDPMGPEFIEFQKGTFEGQDYKIWAETDGVQDDTLLEGVTVQYNESTKSLVASGLNLSAGEKVYIQYRVKLDTTGEGFDFEKWYATNNKATLLPYEGGEERAFPEPMVKGEKTVVEEPKEELPEGTEEEPEAAAEEAEAAKTGDSASTGILTVLLMLSTASLVLLLKKNEEDN